MIDFSKFNDNISNEMLAAYIDGNATMEECILIDDTLDKDSMLSEAFNIVCDCMPYRNNDNWDTFNKSIDLFTVEISDMEDTLIQAAKVIERQNDMSHIILYDNTVVENLSDIDFSYFPDTDLSDY